MNNDAHERARERMRGLIKEHGFTSLYVPGDAENVALCYTIGLSLHEANIELIVFGFGYEHSLAMLHRIGQRILAGNIPPIDTDLDDIFQAPFKARFHDATPDAFAEYGLRSIEHRKEQGRTDAPRVLQLVWQDAEQRWPWEPGFNLRQPLLSPISTARLGENP